MIIRTLILLVASVSIIPPINAGKGVDGNREIASSLSAYSNSQIDWELLPTGEVFPIISEELLDKFSKLTPAQLDHLRNEEFSYAFAYVATVLMSGDTDSLPSFCISCSRTKVKAAFGKLTVNLRFDRKQSKLKKAVSFSKPFGNSSPMLEGVFVFPASKHRIMELQKWDLEAMQSVNVEATDFEPLLSEQPRIDSVNMANYCVFFPDNISDKIARYGLAAFRSGKIQDRHLPTVHIALSNEFCAGNKQVSFHKDGVTIVVNGLTVLAEYDFEARKWKVSYPKIESEKSSLIRSWNIRLG